MSKFVFIFITFLSLNAWNAWAIDTFDQTTNLLTIEAVVIDGVQYNDVILRLKDCDVVSVKSSSSYQHISDTCSEANITTLNYNAITPDMTLDQVNQIIGCKDDITRTLYAGTWIIRMWDIPYSDRISFIQVWFSVDTDTVLSDNGDDYKGGHGLY